MMLVDAHCHLQYFKEDEQSIVISRSEALGIKAIINNGTDDLSNRETLAISKKFPVVRPAFGLHPVDAANANQDQIEKTLSFIRQHSSKIAAVGEIGLDYHWIKDDKAKKHQAETFSLLLEMAKKIKKPAIVHSREAESDTVEAVILSGISGAVLHCFCGNAKLASKALDYGCYFSIPATIVRSMQFKTMAKEIPLSNILTETDAPYLSPFRGKPNEPANVIETIKELSKIKNISADEVAEVIYGNYKKIFK